MSAALSTDRYSAEVVLSLLVGGQRIRLSQVGPDFVLLAEPASIAPSPAEVEVNVDGHIHRREVYLVNGVDPAVRRSRITPRPI